MPDVMIGVPWRGGDPWRERTYRHVLAHLTEAAREACMGSPLVADDGSDPFSRAGSRNQIMCDTDADVVILHDADMLAPLHAYSEMATLAHESSRLVIGYTEYRALDEDTSRSVLEGSDPFRARPLGATWAWSRGGIVAIRRELWHAVGGMDERFRGWGCEDWAFEHAASVVLGPSVRVETPAVHLWHHHSSGAHPELETANSELMAAYMAATTPDELELVRTGG